MSERLSWDLETGEEIFPPDYNPIELLDRLRKVDWSQSNWAASVRRPFVSQHILGISVSDPRTGLPYRLSTNQKLLDLDESLWRDGIIPGYGHRLHNFGWIPTPLVSLTPEGYDYPPINAVFANYDQGYFFPGGYGMRHVIILPKAVKKDGLTPKITQEVKDTYGFFLQPNAEEDVLFRSLLNRVLPPLE